MHNPEKLAAAGHTATGQTSAERFEAMKQHPDAEACVVSGAEGSAADGRRTHPCNATVDGMRPALHAADMAASSAGLRCGTPRCAFSCLHLTVPPQLPRVSLLQVRQEAEAQAGKQRGDILGGPAPS